MKEQSIILYDGDCGLCSRLVRFVIKRDPRKRFVFASLQSNIGIRIWQACRGEDGEAAGADTFALLQEQRLYTKSSAGLLVLKHLQSPWPMFYWLILFPRGIRDWVYDQIAQRRHWLVRSDSCSLTPGLTMDKDRIIEDAAWPIPILDEAAGFKDHSC